MPYDAEKQNYAPLAARQIETPARRLAERHVELCSDYDRRRIADRRRVPAPGIRREPAQPYKTIYMQHGSGQDQSDWMNMGNVPVIMDNLLQDGDTEPAIVVTTNTAYLGASNQGYPNLRNVVMPFVETNYNVSTLAKDRAFAGLSAGAGVTSTSSTSTRRSSATTASSAAGSESATPRRMSGPPTSSSVAGRGTSVCPTRPRLLL